MSNKFLENLSENSKVLKKNIYRLSSIKMVLNVCPAAFCRVLSFRFFLLFFTEPSPAPNFVHASSKEHRQKY